jgi:hypothetical protein
MLIEKYRKHVTTKRIYYHITILYPMRFIVDLSSIIIKHI